MRITVAIVAVLVSVALAQDLANPLPLDQHQPIPQAPIPVVAILRNVQVNPDAFGTHSSDFETENGIHFKFSGKEGVNGGANHIGEYSYVMEDGKVAKVTYVADEFGYQPQSDLLPIAPAFPHPIPQFVLDQIEKARLEDEAKAREAAAHAEAEALAAATAGFEQHQQVEQQQQLEQQQLEQQQFEQQQFEQQQFEQQQFEQQQFEQQQFEQQQQPVELLQQEQQLQ